MAREFVRRQDGIGHEFADCQGPTENASAQTAKAPPQEGPVKTHGDVAQGPSDKDAQQPTPEGAKEASADGTTDNHPKGPSNFTHGGLLPETTQSK
jgi:hypothetical protein